MLIAYLNALRSTHNSPSRLTVFGNPALKKSGASNRFPFRDYMVDPFQ
jgi:hypothetical protein